MEILAVLIVLITLFCIFRGFIYGVGAFVAIALSILAICLFIIYSAKKLFTLDEDDEDWR